MEKIQTGRVWTPGPAVKVVTTISSKDRAKASSPPANSAERTNGKVMSTNVRKVVEDDHDAEGGVADAHREHSEATAPTW